MTDGDVNLKRWQLYRMAYQGLMVLLFCSIAFYFGPNVILFGKLTWLSPTDFVPTVEQQCMPIVSAMKANRRDHGRLPNRMSEIVPDYVVPKYRQEPISNGNFQYWSKFNHRIEYDFTPGNEGWYVNGAFVKGPIPVMKAPVGPSTSPSTQPSK